MCHRAMNKEVWAKLPADVQKVFDANRDFWTEATNKEMFKPEEEGKAMAIKPVSSLSRWTRPVTRNTMQYSKKKT